MERIMYRSTTGRAPLADRRKAILVGQPEDGGLYVPTFIPKYVNGEKESLRGASFAEVGYSVMKKFLKGELPDEKIQWICKEALNYEFGLERVYGNIYAERQDSSSSGAFKDTAARILAREISCYMEGEDSGGIVIVSTSGDTGAAIAASFYKVPGISVIVLYPKNHVTKRQARLMDTLGDNIIALACDGVFDDLQSMIITALGDQDLNKYNLIPANSIGYGRAQPQVIHFIYPQTVEDIIDSGGDPVISIPSGNFGHTYAWFLGREMDAYSEMGVIATNANDVFPRFMVTGKYEPKPAIPCISNAMNVGDPSNMRRIFDLFGGTLIKEKGGSRVVKMPDMAALREACCVTSITNAETLETMKRLYSEFGVILEPHGAVALKGLEKYLLTRDDKPVSVFMETAHPAKFNEELDKLGIEVETPEYMLKAERKSSLAIPFSNEFKDLKEFIISGEIDRILSQQRAKK